jgi:hypothetical protein
VRGEIRRCRNRALAWSTSERYRRVGKLTDREALWLKGTATTRGRRLCLEHSIQALDEIWPGVTKRFWASRKEWRRDTTSMRQALRCQFVCNDGAQCTQKAMHPRTVDNLARRRRQQLPRCFCHTHTLMIACKRDHLAPPDFLVSAPKGRRCKAVCSGKRRPHRRGKPCKLMATPGFDVCWRHGSRGASFGKNNKPRHTTVTRQAKRQAQILEGDRREEMRAQRRAAGLPPLITRWSKAEQQPRSAPQSLYEEFRRGTIRGEQRPRDWWTPYES